MPAQHDDTTPSAAAHSSVQGQVVQGVAGWNSRHTPLTHTSLAAHWIAHRTTEGVAARGHGSELHGAQPSAAPDLGYLSTSLALCLSLSLVLAAGASLDARGRTRLGRSLWLFGAVPVLGLLGEVVVDSGWTVALVAMRVAHGILGLAEHVARAVGAPRSLFPHAGRQAFPPSRSARVPASRLAPGGGQRAPPAPLPAC